MVKRNIRKELTYSNTYAMPAYWSHILVFSVLVDTEDEKRPITYTNVKSYQKTRRNRGKCSFELWGYKRIRNE